MHDHHGKAKDQYVVAIDSVGAGHGDMVMYATGSSARQTTFTKDKPCDAVIMGIVDSWDLGGAEHLREVERGLRCSWPV
ncbi:MAG: EutN/CcmL family microcompartment protein [Planctomycetota bacterium]